MMSDTKTRSLASDNSSPPIYTLHFHSQTGHVWKRAERVHLPKFLSFQETCSRPDAQNARMFKSTKTAPFARHWLEKGEFFKQQNAFISRTILFILHSYHSKDT